jgi:tetratricopeptide (TPR) repeat protein
VATAHRSKAFVTEHLNPYIAGAPVTDARMFFGREDVFEWIERSLTGQYADHILVIHGQRRVGKTSVLRQLPARLPSRYIPVFFDFQGRTHTSLDRFLWWLSREIIRILKQDHGLLFPLPGKEAFTQDPDYLENQFLPGLRPSLGDHVLLLTFDEFDCLEEAEIRGTLGRPLVDYLRRLMVQPGLNFIFSIGSSGRKLENMQASYTEFFKTALYKKISFLHKEDARSLIASPVLGILEYEAAAVDKIFSITSGHPYFTQLICHELFARCQKTKARRVRREDVQAVLDDVVERGTVNLKFVWDEASDLEKWTLAHLAHMEGKGDTRSLEKALGSQRVRFTSQELNSAMLHMREQDVLTEDNRFVIHLMRIWLQKNRPLEQVREELVDVNPIASRFVEIGLEYKDIGQHEKAIGSFQEALVVDPENLRAQVSIAAVRLGQQAYNEAVVEYEKALAIDEEDVAARAGLCEAHLALGDQALSRDRINDAIQSYQQVLSINAEHTDARQQMADIYKQRADAAVAEARFDQALSDYRKALTYTPEDQALEARYAELRDVHREQVIKSLSLRAEKAISAERWAQAVRALEEAQHLAPEDEALRQKLTEVRTAQRAHGLSTLKQRAQQQTRSERWDEVIESWQAYLAFEPDDRQAAQAEIQRALAEQKKTQAYDEARKAISSKEYDRAVQLLKGIVFEDETYKDASRLMAAAVELRRAAGPFWKSRRLWGGIAILVIGSISLLLTRPQFQRLFARSANIFTPPSNTISFPLTASKTPLVGVETAALGTTSEGVEPTRTSRFTQTQTVERTEALPTLTQQARIQSMILRGHTNTVWSVAWSPDGTMLASGSEDQTARIWDVSSGAEMRFLKMNREVESVSWSPDGAQLATPGWSGRISIWDIDDAQVVRLLFAEHWSFENAWSPDGTMIVSIRRETSSAWVDILSLSSGRSFHSFQTNEVSDFEWSPDSSRVATGHQGSVRIWDAETGGEITTLKPQPSIQGQCYIAWSPDNTQLFMGCGSRYSLWNVINGKEIWSFTSSSVSCAAWSPYDSMIAVGRSDGGIDILDAETGERLHSLAGHASIVHGIDWSPDGTKLASGSADKTIRVWQFP